MVLSLELHIEDTEATHTNHRTFWIQCSSGFWSTRKNPSPGSPRRQTYVFAHSSELKALMNSNSRAAHIAVGSQSTKEEKTTPGRQCVLGGAGTRYRPADAAGSRPDEKCAQRRHCHITAQSRCPLLGSRGPGNPLLLSAQLCVYVYLF